MRALQTAMSVLAATSLALLVAACNLLGEQFQNPVFYPRFPDPGAIEVDGTY